MWLMASWRDRSLPPLPSRDPNLRQPYIYIYGSCALPLKAYSKSIPHTPTCMDKEGITPPPPLFNPIWWVGGVRNASALGTDSMAGGRSPCKSDTPHTAPTQPSLHNTRRRGVWFLAQVRPGHSLPPCLQSEFPDCLECSLKEVKWQL